MPTRKPSAPDDPEQSRRFIDMAREVGADEDVGSEGVFGQVVRKLGATPKDSLRAKAKPTKKNEG